MKEYDGETWFWWIRLCMNVKMQINVFFAEWCNDIGNNTSKVSVKTNRLMHLLGYQLSSKNDASNGKFTIVDHPNI